MIRGTPELTKRKKRTGTNIDRFVARMILGILVHNRRKLGILL